MAKWPVALTETTGLVHADLTVGANVAAAKKLAMQTLASQSTA
jgi:hypothetical protein